VKIEADMTKEQAKNLAIDILVNLEFDDIKEVLLYTDDCFMDLKFLELLQDVVNDTLINLKDEDLAGMCKDSEVKRDTFKIWKKVLKLKETK